MTIWGEGPPLPSHMIPRFFLEEDKTRCGRNCKGMRKPGGQVRGQKRHLPPFVDTELGNPMYPSLRELGGVSTPTVGHVNQRGEGLCCEAVMLCVEFFCG